jgi:alkanesulfonate monooxygenase SsuD/methylene tetrahydromethanopterin reductase-like flavin-dependent oxidoreductase (luciferase family)
MWVSGGSRLPDPGEHDVPVIAKTVMDRVVKAGNWLSRCSGTQEWVKRDWGQLQEHARSMGRDPKALTFGHCNFIHLVDTADHDKAVAKSRQPFERVMGTHRSYDHLQECYMIGSIDRINARIADLVGAGLEYLVLGPVSDDPKQFDLLAKRVVANFA